MNSVGVLGFSIPLLLHPRTVDACGMSLGGLQILGQLDTGGMEAIPTFGWAFVKMILVLVTMLLGLLGVLRWLGPRLAAARQSDPSGVMEVVASMRLEPKKTVYLIRLAGRYLLIGSSESGMVTLADASLDQEAIARAIDHDDAGSPRSPANPKGSSAFLKRLMEKRPAER